MKLCPSHFAAKLKKERDAKALSQFSLAKKAKVTQADVSRMESGAHKPNLVKFVRLCNALEVSADSLLQK